MKLLDRIDNAWPGRRMNETPRGTLIVSLLMLMVFAFSPAVFAEVRVIELDHLTAEEALPVVRDLLGEQGRASTLNNRLILNAPAGEISAIEHALAELDTPRAVLQIAVRQETRSVEAGTEFSAEGQARRGDIRLKAGGSDDENGISVGVERDNAGLRLGTDRRIGNVNRRIEQQMRVREGEQAFLTVGEQVPYTREMAVLVDRYGAKGYAQSIDYQRVSTGFRVRPYLQDEHVLLQITPRLERAVTEEGESVSGAPAIHFQNLTSTVRIPLGQWYNLSSHLERTSDVGRSFLKWSAGGEQERRQVLVRVEKVD